MNDVFKGPMFFMPLDSFDIRRMLLIIYSSNFHEIILQKRENFNKNPENFDIF